MKKEDIFEALGDIDAEVVLNAAPKMNKVKKNTFVLRLVAVAACVVLLVSAVVVSTLVLNREDENQPDVPSDSNESDNPTELPDKEVEYFMYADFSTSSSGEASDSKIPFKSNGKKIFSNTRLAKIDKPENAPDTVEITIQGKKYSAEYLASEITHLFSSEKFREFMPISKYSDRNREYSIELDAKGTLRLFIDFEPNRSAEGNFTEEEAIEKARAIVAELYGDEVFDRYNEVRVSYSENNGGREKAFYVYFERKIFGMDTEDNISLDFNMEGELLAINAKKMGTMASAEQDLTQEDIDNAIKAFSETFENAGGWHYSAPSWLVIDSEGDYYLRGGASKKTDSGTFAMQIHINVK